MIVPDGRESWEIYLAGFQVGVMVPVTLLCLAVAVVGHHEVLAGCAALWLVVIKADAIAAWIVGLFLGRPADEKED